MMESWFRKATRLVEEGELDASNNDKAASLIDEAGVAVVRGATTRRAAEALWSRLEPTVLRTMAALEAHSSRPLDSPSTFAFAECCGRGSGRVDVKVDEGSEDVEARALSIASRVLDDGVVRARGVVVSSPGAAAQRWHRDGDHLFPNHRQLPAHAVTVFFPLVDMEPGLGPTRFLPGSHVGPDHVEPITAPAAEPLLLKGDAVIFDYRTVHRGGAHTREGERPVYYVVVTKSWFSDTYNFPSNTSLFERPSCVSLDEDSPSVCVVSSNAAYKHVSDADTALAKATASARFVYGSKSGEDAAAALASECGFTYCDSLCFLRDCDWRNRELHMTPPAPDAASLGIALDERPRDLEVARVPAVAGFGVFALDAIDPGDLVAEYAGLVAPADTVDPYALDYAQTLDGQNLALSARLYGNVARFVNHDSANPNAEIKRCTHNGLLRVLIIAIRPIKRRDQILVDYGASYWRGLGIAPIPLAPPKRVSGTPKRTTPRFSVRAAKQAMLTFLTDVDDSPGADADRSANDAWRDFETW